MRRTICTLGLFILPLLPYQRIGAAPITPEGYGPIQRSSIRQIDEIRPVELAAQTTLELQYRQVPNPCSDGCGYAWGNCTYGVALWREGLGMPVGDDWGNANTWAVRASQAGLQVDNVPNVNDIAQTSRGYYGHVALVEQVDGDKIYILEMNSVGLGVTDERWVMSYDYTFIGQ